MARGAASPPHFFAHSVVLTLTRLGVDVGHTGVDEEYLVDVLLRHPDAHVVVVDVDLTQADTDVVGVEVAVDEDVTTRDQHLQRADQKKEDGQVGALAHLDPTAQQVRESELTRHLHLPQVRARVGALRLLETTGAPTYGS